MRHLFCDRKLLSPLPGICFYTPYLLGTYVVIESSTAEHLVLQNLPTRHLFCSRKISRMRITTARHRDFGLIALGCQACRHRKEVLTATSCGGGIIYKYIANQFYLSHSCIGNMYVMYIHLPGRHYDVNLFHPQAFVSEQSLPSLSILFFGLLLDDMQLLVRLHSAVYIGCLYRLLLLRKVVFGLPVRFSSASRSF